MYENRRSEQVVPYVVQTLSLTLVFTVLAVGTVTLSFLKFDHYEEMFVLLSYLHITFAFATSLAHPDWIVRWFSCTKQKAPV